MHNILADICLGIFTEQYYIITLSLINTRNPHNMSHMQPHSNEGKSSVTIIGKTVIFKIYILSQSSFQKLKHVQK